MALPPSSSFATRLLVLGTHLAYTTCKHAPNDNTQAVTILEQVRRPKIQPRTSGSTAAQMYSPRTKLGLVVIWLHMPGQPDLVSGYPLDKS